MNMFENKIIKIEQQKLDELDVDLKISMCSSSLDKDNPNLIGVVLPLKGNKEIIKKLENCGWYRAYKKKRNDIFYVYMHKSIYYQKYAIYQKSYGGLYAKEYYDNVNDLKRAGLIYINPNSLPVTVNRKGGYTSFIEEYDKKEGFIKIITVLENEEPLTREQMYPKNSDKFKFGWIDRAGNTYACEFEGHCYAAEVICKELGLKVYNEERELEECGWIKMSRNIPYTSENIDKAIPYFNMHNSKVGGYISTKQYEKLCELGYENYPYIKYWLRN